MRLWDAIVVGGGPAGAATAITLGECGLSVVLLDACAFPRSKPCGDAVSPGAIPLLEELGVWEAVAGVSTSIDGWRIQSPNGTAFDTLFDLHRQGTPPRGLCIDRLLFDDILLDEARSRGVMVRERVRVFRLLRHGGRVVGVKARGPGGEEIEIAGRFVVGADGLRSRVARELGGVRAGRRRRLGVVGRWMGVRTAAPGTDPGGESRGELRVTSDGVLGFAPLRCGAANVTLVVPLACAKALAPDPLPFFMDRLETWDLAERLAGAALSRPLDVTGPFEVLPARRSAPGAILVGDAAGYFDPFTGQGVFRALHGARLAAAVVRAALASPGDEPAALRAYGRAMARRLPLSRAVQHGIDAVVSRPRRFDATACRLRGRSRLTSLLADITGDRIGSRGPAIGGPAIGGMAIGGGRRAHA